MTVLERPVSFKVWNRRYDFVIPPETYNSYRMRERKETNDLENMLDFVTPDEPVLVGMMERVAHSIVGRDWRRKKRLTARAILRMLLAVEYHAEGNLIPAQYPIETLGEGKGNCFDLSVLGASWLSAAGIASCFVDISAEFNQQVLGSDTKNGHVLLGISVPEAGRYVVLDRRRFYLAEVSGINEEGKRHYYRIGEYDPLCIKEKGVSLVRVS